MGETPDQIRDEIEQTRGRMGDTAEAIAYKADVKSRGKESVAEKKDALVGTISGGRDAVVGAADSVVARVGGIVPESQEVKDGGREDRHVAREPARLRDRRPRSGLRARHAAPEDGRREPDARPALGPGDRQGEGGRAGVVRARQGGRARTRSTPRRTRSRSAATRRSTS